MSGDEGVPREAYEWKHAITDLALSTSLTASEAFDLTYPIRELGVHPYDVMPPLSRLLHASGDTRQRGAALAALLSLKRE